MKAIKENIVNSGSYKNPEELSGYSKITSSEEPVNAKDRGFVTDEAPLDSFIKKNKAGRFLRNIKKIFKK